VDLKVTLGPSTYDERRGYQVWHGNRFEQLGLGLFASSPQIGSTYSKHQEEKMSSISLELPKRSTAESSKLAASVADYSARFTRILKGLSARLSLSWLAAISYLATVAVVAVYDIVLTIRYANFLAQLEENPIGRWIMNLKSSTIHSIEVTPNIAPFIALKVLGTLVVLGVIVGLIRWRSRMGHLVGLGVSAFQLGLAAYLTYC
jgi:hypothetical protein